MKRQEAMAYPILGFQVLAHPDVPTVSVLALQTEAGPHLFAGTAEIWETIGNSLLKQAAILQKKGKLS